MFAMDNLKRSPTLGFGKGLHGIFWALALFSAGFAGEPATSVAYKSAFTGYRSYDAQAPAIDWRHANENVREGAEDGAHEMHATHESEASSDSEHAEAHDEPAPPAPADTVPQQGERTAPPSTDSHAGHH